MLFLKILEDLSIEKQRIGEMKIDYIKNQVQYTDIRIKIPGDENSLYEKQSEENIFQFDKIFNRQVSQELMYSTSEQILESSVNIFIGTEQTSRFQYFKLYLNRFIQYLNEQITSYEQSQIQDNYQFYPDIQELFNKDYTINIQTMTPKATQIDRNKDISISKNKEIFVQIARKNSDISTYFYYGPSYTLKNKNFYFILGMPYQRTQDLVNNFRQHLLLRKIYTQIQKTNIFMFIVEYEDNLSILKQCKGFYNGVLKTAKADVVTDNQLQVLQDKISLLQADVEKYRKCFEEEHILRLQQEKMYREEIQILNERLAVVASQINAPLRQEQSKLHNPSLKRKRVEDL